MILLLSFYIPKRMVCFLRPYPLFMLLVNLHIISGEELVDLLIDKTKECLHVMENSATKEEVRRIKEELRCIMEEIRRRKKDQGQY